MKKLFKKIAAVFMVAVIAVSAFVLPTTTASAAGVFDGAKKMEALEYYSTAFSSSVPEIYYKIVIPSSGTVTLRVSDIEIDVGAYVALYNTNAEKVYEETALYAYREKKIENLKKGTYYLLIRSGQNWQGTYQTINDLYYTFTPDLKPTISLKVTITKGTTLQLGSIVENYDGKVTWESTKKSVATVTSKGKVTAKKKGTTTIRAKLSDGTYVQIRVVVKNPTTKKTTTSS